MCWFKREAGPETQVQRQMHIYLITYFRINKFKCQVEISKASAE